MNTRDIVKQSIAWFERSGVMRPADGFWGIAERICIIDGNVSMDDVNQSFPCQTPLGKGAVVLEHRRPDCIVETAVLMDLAADYLARPELKTVADNLLEYLLCRSHLRNRQASSPARDLWGWANPGNRETYWVDDNAWLVTGLLLMADRGRESLVEPAVAAARALLRLVGEYLENPERPDPAFAAAKIKGVLLNPHWLGLATMAFAHASVHDGQTDYASVVRRYHEIVLAGPPRGLKDVGQSQRGLPWPLSEYAYLALTASVAAACFGDRRMEDVARTSADLLVSHQSPQGHWSSEHYESPAASHLADLVYTQNWATLGLLHAGRVLGEARYVDAARRSLEFLSSIQDRCDDPRFAGCWRGMYDVRAGRWGGGDLHEGGQSSIYSGWTNAPICLAFILDATGGHLLAGTES